MHKKLFLLDAMALIFRAYYAMVKSPRYTSKGLNTSAILGFTNTLNEVLRNEKPTHIAVSFDTGAPTIRHADFAQYKAHREATPDDIVNSIPYIKRILEAYNIPIIIMDGYEADDIIGTAAKRAEIEGFEVYMMTSDKDYGQLVSKNIFMYKPGRFGQKAEVVGLPEICEKYAIDEPEQLIDILGLWGDTSDNIPGVPGIGEVKAKKLISQFGSIENIYKRIDEVDNAKLKQTLLEYKEQAFMSKMLATIVLDVPVTLDFDVMRYVGPDEKKLKEVFDELEFKSLSQRVFKELNVSNTKKKVSSGPDLFSEVDEYSKTDDSKESCFSCYDHIEHTLIEIKKEKALKNYDHVFFSDILFFEWIITQGKCIGMAFSNGGKEVYYHYGDSKEPHTSELLKKIFEKGKTVVTFQCKQTYKILFSFDIRIDACIFDLQIAHYLIQPENTHLLERLTEKYLNYSLIQQKADRQESLLFSDEAHPVSSGLLCTICERVEVYRNLYDIFKEEMNKNNVFSLFSDVEMPLAGVLAKMEYTGVRLDTQTLKESADTLNNDLLHIEKEIFSMAGITFNLASPKQLGEVLFEKLRIIDNAKLTKTKQYQTGEEVLIKLVNKHPIVPLILEWRSLSKLKTTYIDALPQLINPETGRIHTTFNQTVTSTGRLSSVNPNLQNIPIRTERGKEIRRAFVPSDADSVMISADYSQIELRIVASVCGDKSMIASFKSGQDIHSAMAAKIYGVSLEEVTPLMRRNAKTVNFGILYGISAFGLADRLHIPQREARELIEGYFRTFPKINEYLEHILQFAREHGYVETLLGRRRYIADINSHNAILRKASERNAINAPIQGTAADLIKIAMVNIQKRLDEVGLKSKMIMQVHDELVFDVPNEEVETMKEIISELMSGAMELNVPLSVEIGVGKSWFDAH